MVGLHWTQKYDQGVHEDYPLGLHRYDERYEVLATPKNSSKFTDFDLKKVKILSWKIKNEKNENSHFQVFSFKRKPKLDILTDVAEGMDWFLKHSWHLPP